MKVFEFLPDVLTKCRDGIRDNVHARGLGDHTDDAHWNHTTLEGHRQGGPERNCHCVGNRWSLKSALILQISKLAVYKTRPHSVEVAANNGALEGAVPQ